MPYIAALDGIRGIAVLMVVVFHAKAPFLVGGFFGVDVFFVLSGFLITSLLQAELARTGRIDLKRFYARRLLRLTPPLFLTLTLYWLIAPYAWPTYASHTRDTLLAATYMSDYTRALWNMPDMLRHTWSLAIEEHFYLGWPLVLLTLRQARPRTVLIILVGLYVLATVWRISCASSESWQMVYYRFDTRLSGLMLGAVVSVLLSVTTQKRYGRYVFVAALYAFTFIAFAGGWRDPAALKFGVIAAEFGAAVVIVGAMRADKYVHWLAWQPLTYIGRLSYGIYLFHFPIMLYLRSTYGWETALALGTFSSCLLAALSHHTMEAWVRRWRNKHLIASNTATTP